MSVTVPTGRAEEARARMVELFPAGFEELEHDGEVELAAYTDPAGEERLWHAFGSSSARDVPADWEDRWRQFHRPVRVGELWIGPPWERPPPDVQSVTIDPGRAFGTGGHRTTQLCLEFLRALPRGSVLDVGCGSGVLGIGAARLGFAPVLAVDLDPAAVEATAANAALNGVEVEVRLIDALAAPLPPADIALANITREVVVEVAPTLRVTRLVTSGYLSSEELLLPGFRPVERRERDGWAADLFERSSA